MIFNNGKLTIVLPDRDKNDLIEIRISESDSKIYDIIKVKISQTNFLRCLARFAYAPCQLEIDMDEIPKLGKRMETQTLEFQLPSFARDYDHKAIARKLALFKCPKGWEPDLYFGSRDSIVYKDGKYWANTIIRRWI